MDSLKCDKFNNVGSRINFLAIALLFEVEFAFSSVIGKYSSKEIFDKLYKDDVYYDLVEKDNYTALEVHYGNYEFDFGNEIPPEALGAQPVVRWPAPVGAKYTLVCVGPDVPSKFKYSERSWLHWHVGNIPENMTNRGDVRVEYVGISTPTYASGPHRIVFLLFRQPDDSDFYYITPVINSDNFDDRTFFSPRVMSKEHNLKNPVALNYAFTNIE